MGGVRRHNAELLPRVARILAERGAELSVLEGTTPIAFDLPDEVVRIPCDVPAGPPLTRATAEGRVVRAELEAASASGRPYSLVHTAHLPAPRNLDTPLTLTLHDVRRLDKSLSTRLQITVARFTLQRALNSAARIFCVTEAVRGELMHYFGLPSDRIRILPNAADHFTPLPRSTDHASGLLHIGHLEPRKNLELLLRALALDPELPSVTLAGAAKGDETERLQALARELDITERVHFLGPVAEERIPELLANAACVVMPSRVEGFGIGALEAQRAGVPLAISNITALREVAGERTPHFPPDDPAACAQAIRVALTADPSTIEAARTQAERYSWDASAATWVAAWEELIPHA